MKRPKKLYMKTTSDDLELPIAVAESTSELARMLHVTEGSVLSGFGHKYKCWHKVIIDNEDEEIIKIESEKE